MSLPALDDIVTHTGTTDPIDGVVRIETAPLEETAGIFISQMRSVYSHDEVFGQYCTVNEYVDCPPDELFDYMADTRSLEEWTYSLRDFTPSDEPGLWLAYDRLLPETTIYTRTSPIAGAHGRLPLRVGSGQAPVDDLPDAGRRRAGGARTSRVRLCCGRIAVTRSTTRTRIPKTAPAAATGWVGDFWDMFGAGHKLELNNLKSIAEYRHHNGLPVTPAWMR